MAPRRLDWQHESNRISTKNDPRDPWPTVVGLVVIAAIIGTLLSAVANATVDRTALKS